MAFRIHESVVRGEIDNRVKGVVRGRIWVHGRAEPVLLELEGNAHPDLAGCLLTFTNPLPTTPHEHLNALHPMQNGAAGDLTASRKVRVYDIPVREAYLMSKRGEKPPEHMANSLYLEWFSDYNGRVVVESAGYVLQISAPEWRMTPEENEQRARQAASGMDDFMQLIAEAGEDGPGEVVEDKEWNEFDFEKAMKESDAVTDKYMELLEKYQDEPDAEALIAREMGWDEEDEEEEEDGEFASAAEDAPTVEEMNEICAEAAKNPPQLDPLTEGVDWIRTKDDYVKHPLCHRVFEGALALRRELEELKLDRAADEDLRLFVSEYQITGAKLAGALNRLGYGRDHVPGGLVVASLKRALNHLHQTQGGLEALATAKTLPDALVTQRRRELFEVREEILRLMQEFRER